MSLDTDESQFKQFNLSYTKNFIFDCLSTVTPLLMTHDQGLATTRCVLGYSRHNDHSTGQSNETLCFYVSFMESE